MVNRISISVGGIVRGRWAHNITDSQYIERMKARVQIDSKGCWVWQGFRHKPPRDYGEMSYRNKSWRAHRLMWHLINGPIPAGRIVCHTCDNTGCINPDHLWLGTHHENMTDCRNKDRYHYAKLTHCKRGHSFDDANTYYIKTPGEAFGLRQCKACQRIRQRIKSGWPEEKALAEPSIPPGAVTERRTFRKRTASPTDAPL